MSGDARIRSVLFATTGLQIGGGIASVSRCISRALEEEVASHRLDRLDILSLYDPPDAPIRCNGDQLCARGSRIRFILHARTLLKNDPDLLILDHLGLGRAFRIPLAGLRAHRTALFIHGTEFWAVEGGVRASVVRNADSILTNSMFTAESVVEKLPELRDRVCPVLLCIDPDLIATWSALQPATPRPRELAVLIVARMCRGEPGKGHVALIEAWPRVRKSVPTAQLWIVGDGDARSDFERRAVAIGAEGVSFLGKVSDQELSMRYRQASLFAMPSRQEGFGLVYAEAMWHGLPCIGSSSDAAQEIIRDGQSGAIVPYGDSTRLSDTIIEL
ncbi:glycosyltransferase family 4 protein, partial [Myxococcota bacterium]|nr:glycosyltransferase family 4 protein [Myxococcota bacterium]